MPKAHRVHFAGGINQVLDKRLPHGGFAAHLDNANVRSGGLRPFYLPSIMQEVTPPSGSRFIFYYRGAFIFSANRREYSVDQKAGSDVVYYTEYGSGARKIVSGIDVPLAIPAPLFPPAVHVGSLLTPQQITITELGSGSIPSAVKRSYRLSFTTSEGKLPASAYVVGTTTHANSGFQLDWLVPASDVRILQVNIYAASDAIGSERFVASVGGAETRYVDNGSVSSLGEPASIYDQDAAVQYVQTWERDVNGMIDETGPSPISPVVKTSTTRKLVFDPSSDGLNDMEQWVDWGASPAGVTWPNLTVYDSLAQATSVDGKEYVAPCTALALDVPTQKLKATFDQGAWAGTSLGVAPGLFMDDEEVIVTNWTSTGALPNPFLNSNGDPMRIPVEVIPGDAGHIFLRPTFPVDLAGAGTVTFNLKRIIEVDVTSFTWNPIAKAVELHLAGPHTFKGGETARFNSASDTNWMAANFRVTPSSADPFTLFVYDAPVPTNVTSATKALCMVKVATHGVNLGAAAALPTSGDMVSLTIPTLATKLTTAAATAYAGIVAQNSADWFGLNLYLDLGAGASHKYDYTSPTGGVLAYLYKNAYISARKIYRTGTTGEWRLVARLAIDTPVFSDVVADAELGDILPTFYVTNDGTSVLFSPPPSDLFGITTHLGMNFGISGLTVRWTAVGQSSGWSEFYKKGFAYRPVALVSLDFGLLVLCEDQPYRLDGNDPNTLSPAVVPVKYGCRAPYSVQKVHNGVVYLSDAGLVYLKSRVYPGHPMEELLTDLRVVSRVLRGTSYYVNEPLAPGDPASDFTVNSFLIPTRQTHFYRNVVEDGGYDYDAVLPPFIRGTGSPVGLDFGIRSFYHRGRYFLYYQYDDPNHQAQTMLCVDLNAPGYPVTTLSLKPQDVVVGEDDRAYVLMPLPSLTSDPVTPA